MISQTVQFTGCNARRLYDAYLSSADHAAMTVDGTQAATFRRGASDVGTGGEGDELRAFGMPGTGDPGPARWPVAGGRSSVTPCCSSRASPGCLRPATSAMARPSGSHPRSARAQWPSH